jgi:hypothetical protein
MFQDIAGIGPALIVALDVGLDLVTGTLEVINSTSQAVTPKEAQGLQGRQTPPAAQVFEDFLVLARFHIFLPFRSLMKST